MAASTLAEFPVTSPQPLVPPPALLRFVQRRIETAVNSGHDDTGHERREEFRYRLALPVRVTPLDSDAQETEESFVAVSYDISASGASLFHRAGVREKLLALEIEMPNGQRLRRNLEVLRCRSAGLFYEIAGRFVAH